MQTIAKFHHVSRAQYAQDSSDFPAKLAVSEIPLPKRATAGSAGYDFVTPVDFVLEPGKAVTIPTGIRAEMENGWVLLIVPRSSLGFKHQTVLSNTVGVIDSDYFHADNEGHIRIRLVNHGDHDLVLKAGDRVCQGIFVPYGLAEEEDVTSDRSGGFGSTGK